MDNKTLRALALSFVALLDSAGRKIANEVKARSRALDLALADLKYAKGLADPKLIQSAQRAVERATASHMDWIAKLDAIHNRKMDLLAYWSGRWAKAGRPFKARATMLDLPVYQFSKSDMLVFKRLGAVLKGPSSQVLSGLYRTDFDKPYALVQGLTKMSATTDLTHHIQGSARALTRTHQIATRARQVRQADPVSQGLRISLASRYAFWRIGEYHRRALVNAKGKPVSRAEYDARVGYPKDSASAIRALRSLARVKAQWPCQGQSWVLKGHKYARAQIIGLILDVRKGLYHKGQYLPADLYGFDGMVALVQSVLGKSVTVHTIKDYQYWAKAVRAHERKAQSKAVKSAKPKGKGKSKRAKAQSALPVRTFPEPFKPYPVKALGTVRPRRALEGVLVGKPSNPKAALEVQALADLWDMERALRDARAKGQRLAPVCDPSVQRGLGPNGRA